MLTTRGPWTAMPALIKVIETKQINKYFYMPKIFKNWCNFIGKRTVCMPSLTFFLPKRLYFQYNFSWSRRWTIKLYSAIFTTGQSTYMCKRFHQVQASGFCTYPGQPKGVNLGIFCQLLYTSVKIKFQGLVRQKFIRLLFSAC